MRSQDESRRFIQECQFALNHVFQAISDRLDYMRQKSEQLATVQRSEEIFTELFNGRDQWSPHANYYHAQYVRRMAALSDRTHEVNAEEQRRSDELLALVGATNDSIAILAGTVLQVGKQVLSYRYGGKGNLPPTRNIGTQPATELIWEGRNHALHWEEVTGWGPTPSTSVRMLRTLSRDTGAEIIERSNNALTVISVLGWTSRDAVVGDLSAIV